MIDIKEGNNLMLLPLDKIMKSEEINKIENNSTSDEDLSDSEMNSNREER